MNKKKWEIEMQKLVFASVDQAFVSIKVGETDLVVEVAASDLTRTAGLGNRASMPVDGMLFLYPKDHHVAFHRSTMRFDIAMRFFDHAGQLLMTSTANETQANPPTPYRYVLETDPSVELNGTLEIVGITA